MSLSQLIVFLVTLTLTSSQDSPTLFFSLYLSCTDPTQCSTFYDLAMNALIVPSVCSAYDAATLSSQSSTVASTASLTRTGSRTVSQTPSSSNTKVFSVTPTPTPLLQQATLCPSYGPSYSPTAGSYAPSCGASFLPSYAPSKFPGVGRRADANKPLVTGFHYSEFGQDGTLRFSPTPSSYSSSPASISPYDAISFTTLVFLCLRKWVGLAPSGSEERGVPVKAPLHPYHRLLASASYAPSYTSSTFVSPSSSPVQSFLTATYAASYVASQTLSSSPMRSKPSSSGQNPSPSSSLSATSSALTVNLTSKCATFLKSDALKFLEGKVSGLSPTFNFSGAVLSITFSALGNLSVASYARRAVLLRQESKLTQPQRSLLSTLPTFGITVQIKAQYLNTSAGQLSVLNDFNSLVSIFEGSENISGGLVFFFPSAFRLTLNALSVATRVPTAVLSVQGGAVYTMGILSSPSPIFPTIFGTSSSVSLSSVTASTLYVGGGMFALLFLLLFYSVKNAQNKAVEKSNTPLLSSLPDFELGRIEIKDFKNPLHSECIDEMEAKMETLSVPEAESGETSKLIEGATLLPALQGNSVFIEDAIDHTAILAPETTNPAPLPPPLFTAFTSPSDRNDWESVEDPDGDVYYRHKASKATVWFRPGEDVESLVCSETGEKYFVNLMTGLSSWDDPRKSGKLEDVWIESTDRDGDVFWVNELTRATAWNLPSGAKVKIKEGGGGVKVSNPHMEVA